MAGRDVSVGTVEAVDAGTVTVRFAPGSGCLACRTGEGCGLGPVVEMFAPRRARRVRLPRPGQPEIRPGDRVRMPLAGARLAWLALAAYGLPLAGIVVGALAATALFPAGGDLAAGSGAAVGALAAGGVLRVAGFGQDAARWIVVDPRGDE